MIDTVRQLSPETAIFPVCIALSSQQNHPMYTGNRISPLANPSAFRAPMAASLMGRVMEGPTLYTTLPTLPKAHIGVLPTARPMTTVLLSRCRKQILPLKTLGTMYVRETFFRADVHLVVYCITGGILCGLCVIMVRYGLFLLYFCCKYESA